jgi:nucleotide-binding universal stress UspA family protein
MTIRVAVPFDGSDPSRLALAYAFEQFPDAHLTVFHVVTPFPDHTKAGGYDGRRHARVFEDRRRFLTEAVSARPDRPGDVQTELLYGRPRDEVPRYLLAQGFDEVVMGSRGLSKPTDRLLGSVSSVVIRRAPVPVTVVRAPPTEDDPTRPPGPRRVLVAFDGSPRARDALKYAFTRFPGADVTAVFVTTNDEAPDRVVTVGDGGSPTERPGPETDGERVLLTAQRIAAQHDRSLSVVAECGDPATCLATWVRDNDVDHVVVGRSPVRRFRGVLKGSLAETVLSRVSVPVTVVP